MPAKMHTYSIVARDPKTGQLGVAVQSHYFSTGSIVTWAEAGVGAVATQSTARMEYGPEGLAYMREGRSAQEALDACIAEDTNPDVRQVAMVDAEGNVAVHTGPRCIPEAGHATGEGFSVQANIMLNDKVWGAMKQAYESASGDLADRLLAALDAAQAVGGDMRGQQSAAILVVEGDKQEKPGQGRLFDLRVEDHPRPLEELRRLVQLRRAYRLNDLSDELMAAGKFDEAAAALQESLALAPDVVELRFWSALTLFGAGREDEAMPLFRQVFSEEPIWAELLPRLVKPGLIPDDPAALQRILAQRS